MKNLFVFLMLSVLMVNCKEKKKSLQDGDIITMADFIDFFPESTLPVRIADSTLNKKTTDSSLIGYKVFVQFIPDSILARDFGKGVKPKLYPLGKTKEKGKETYLFIKAIAGAKKVGYLACFDKEQKFVSAMPLIRADQDPLTSSFGMLDNKFQITTYTEKKQGANLRFKRNVYIFNSASNDFTLIMTEPNEEMIEEIINPIDTLSRKNKFSGDYIKDKKNYVSIRDSKRAGELLFFIHFEKDNGDCRGELKGTAKLGTKNIAYYNEPGNPCSLEFNFESTTVSLKETGGCGSYRDIKCFFDGAYRKKPEPRSKTSAKKK